jgi:hypothetical protein
MRISLIERIPKVLVGSYCVYITVSIESRTAHVVPREQTERKYTKAESYHQYG